MRLGGGDAPSGGRNGGRLLADDSQPPFELESEPRIAQDETRSISEIGEQAPLNGGKPARRRLDANLPDCDPAVNNRNREKCSARADGRLPAPSHSVSGPGVRLPGVMP